MYIPKSSALRHVCRQHLHTIRIYENTDTGIWYRRDTSFDGKIRDSKTTKDFMIKAWLAFESSSENQFGKDIPERR